MIVTAGACHRQAQDPTTERVDPVGKLVELLGIPVIDRSQGKEPERGQALLTPRLFDKVAGDLVDEEPVVRQIAVQGLDQPVAVAVAMGIKPGLK